MVSEHFDPRQQMVWSDSVGWYTPSRIPNPFRSLAADRPYSSSASARRPWPFRSIASSSGYGANREARPVRPYLPFGYGGGPYRSVGKEYLGASGLRSSGRKIPSRFQSESALEPHLPRQIPDSSDLRRRRGPAELALAVSGPDRRDLKVPHPTPGKIPNPSSDLGKMKEWVVSYEEDATDPTAVWRILHLRPSEEHRKVPDQIQPRKMELEMARRVEYPRQSNLNSTQGKQWMGAPEGNFNPPPTGHSAVLSGWGQNQLPPACLVSPNLNHLNPSQGPKLAKQCSQYPRELRNQFQFQDHSKQWDPNPSNKRVLSVSTVDDDYSYFNNMKIEQLEQTKVKANLCSVEYQPRRVPGKEILEQEVYGIDPYTHNLPKEIVPADLDWSIDDKAEEKQGVNESGDEDTINKDIAVKTNFVMANVPDEAKFYLTQLYMVGRDDKWLWSTGLLWKLPPWPDFCAMSCVSVAQHGGYEVLVNFHPVNRYHISLDKAFEFNDYCRSHQPPISLIKAEVCGLFGSVFCDFGPEITVLDVDGEDPHTGITDNPALVSCDDDEAGFHMKQDAFLYNLGAQMLPKSYHCFSRRLMLEYSKFSSLDSDEPFACKLNNPKHRDTYKQVNVHVLNYEAILWEKLPKFSMQQLYFVGLLWNLPPWPDLNFCGVNWMANGMEKGAGIAAMKDTYNAVTGQSKIYSQQAKSKPFIEAGVKNETVSAPSGTPSTDLIASGNNTPQRCFSPMKSGTGTFENQNNSPGDATPPPGFCCPISMKLMSDPVIIASGHTYEREKLSQFCHVTVANIFSLYDVSNIGHDEESFEFKTDEEEVIDGPEKVVRVWDPGTGLENMKWQSSPLGVVGGLTFGAVSAAGRDQPEDLALKVESALYSVGVAESFCTGQIDKLSFWSQGISQDSPVGTDEFMSLKKPTRLVLRVRKPRAVVNITPAVSSALLMNELQWIGLIVKPIDYSLKDGILHIDASAGLKIEEISTKLREYCPSCFNVSDYKYYLIVENLERASMTNNHDGREILARDAFSLLTRIPESADLSAICKRFEKRRFYEAVIQLILQKAQTLDSIADVINGQINVRPHDTTIAQCELCYQIVMNALSTLKGVGQRGTQRADQSSSSASALDSISRSKYSNQLIPLSVHWPDTALHDHLYITLIEFLEYGGFDLVAFLQSAGHKHQEEVREVSVVASKGSKLHDLCASLSTIQTKYMELLVRYDVLKGEYIVAARSLLIWADVQCSNAKEAPTLDQRYQYLSNAVLQAKSTDIATEFSKNPIDSNITVYPLEGKIAVLQFQTQIKQELEYMAFWLEHIPGSYELLSDPFPRDNIVADAETAMTATDKAIKHVFPSTQHCFSYWHILKNAQSHLGTVYTFQAYQNMCMKCMQGSDSEMELEESWTAMLHEHKPHDNNWLNDLSRFHHRWCSVFNKDTFETGINSSQWGKVPNNILTGIDDESTFLILFSLLLEKVVRVLLRNEFEDFLCNQTAPVRAIKHSTILSRLYILEDKYVFEGEVMSELLTTED